ncbi:MAG: TusE/DsrC/DsvC family sulfur relay protein [Pseudomonadales bacterium]
MADRDHEGFLRSLKDWSPEVAGDIAKDHGIELTPEHWAIIKVLRAFYQDHRVSPPSRVLMKVLTQKLDTEINSIRLMQLFGGRARRHLAQIAGLPKPSDCD